MTAKKNAAIIACIRPPLSAGGAQWASPSQTIRPPSPKRLSPIPRVPAPSSYSPTSRNTMTPQIKVASSTKSPADSGYNVATLKSINSRTRLLNRKGTAARPAHQRGRAAMDGLLRNLIKTVRRRMKADEELTREAVTKELGYTRQYVSGP